MRTGTFYEINVSQKCKGIFATDSHIRNYDASQILEILKLFAVKFPKSEAYEISVTIWHCGCPQLDGEIAEFLKNYGNDICDKKNEPDKK